MNKVDHRTNVLQPGYDFQVTDPYYDKRNNFYQICDIIDKVKDKIINLIQTE